MSIAINAAADDDAVVDADDAVVLRGRRAARHGSAAHVLPQLCTRSGNHWKHHLATKFLHPQVTVFQRVLMSATYTCSCNIVICACKLFMSAEGRENKLFTFFRGRSGLSNVDNRYVCVCCSGLVAANSQVDRSSDAKVSMHAPLLLHLVCTSVANANVSVCVMHLLHVAGR